MQRFYPQSNPSSLAPLSVSECHFDLFINIPLYSVPQSISPESPCAQSARRPPRSFTIFYFVLRRMYICIYTESDAIMLGGFRSISCQLWPGCIYTRYCEKPRSLSPPYIPSSSSLSVILREARGHSATGIFSSARLSTRRKRERETSPARLKRKTNEERL